jgi:hypothetical protein
VTITDPDHILDAQLQAAWKDAVADAGAMAVGVRLYPTNAPVPAGATSAAFVARNVVIDRTVLTDAQVQDADLHTDRPRIVLHVDAPREALIAKLRHELEHVMQWEYGGGEHLFLAYQACNAGVETFIGTDRRGSGVVYNMMPLEADANGAASRFMRTRLGDAVADRLADTAEGVLFRRQVRPPSLATAGVRTVCFAVLGATRVEEWLAPFPGGPRGLLDRVAGDPELWDTLRRDGELARRIGAATDVIPATSALNGTDGNFVLAWGPLRDALFNAYAHALEIAAVRE